MKRFFLYLFVSLLIFNARGQGTNNPSVTAKAGSTNNMLVGTWRLIEFADLDPETNSWTYSYGRNPNGYFTYTKSGIVNLNISAQSPLKISKDSAKNYTINLLKWADSNSVGYFGNYTVDYNKSVVIHHVKGGSLPWYIDTDQPRPFLLKGDTLIIGDNKTWRRVLVKVD